MSELFCEEHGMFRMKNGKCFVCQHTVYDCCGEQLTYDTKGEPEIEHCQKCNMTLCNEDTWDHDFRGPLCMRCWGEEVDEELEWEEITNGM